MKVSMRTLSSPSELNDAPWSALPARIENQISTWLRPGCAGRCKMEVHVWMALQPAIVLRLVRVEVVEDDMNLASGVLSDNPVHEVEKFKAPPPLVLASRHLARRDVEGGEERRRAVPGVIVRLTGQRPAVRHLQVALRALQRLDRRLLVP